MTKIGWLALEIREILSVLRKSLDEAPGCAMTSTVSPQFLMTKPAMLASLAVATGVAVKTMSMAMTILGLVLFYVAPNR